MDGDQTDDAFFGAMPVTQPIGSPKTAMRRNQSGQAGPSVGISLEKEALL